MTNLSQSAEIGNPYYPFRKGKNFTHLAMKEFSDVTLIHTGRFNWKIDQIGNMLRHGEDSKFTTLSLGICFVPKQL